jgi:endoglycosylceramidase
MQQYFISLILVLLLLFYTVNAYNKFIIDTKTSQFLDSDGRESFFHGVNVVYKAFPWYPKLDTFDAQYSFAPQDMQYLSDIGFNIIRLGVQWPGVEPVRGQYNYTYINVVKQILHDMQKYELYALLDFHQDDFSEKFCGEGVPLWAAIPSNNSRGFPEPWNRPYPVGPNTGVPSDEDCAKVDWAEYQVSEAAASAYQSLYDNVDGIQDSFCKFWAIVAKELGHLPNVLGYEIINEPFAGDVYRHPKYIWPAFADRENLLPMYDKVNDAIRSMDPEGLIFFEPVTWSDVGTGFPRGKLLLDCHSLYLLYYHSTRIRNIPEQKCFVLPLL